MSAPHCETLSSATSVSSSLIVAATPHHSYYTIESVEIAGFKSVASSSPVRLSLAPRGVTVVQGANGSGKSTLLDGVVAALGIGSFSSTTNFAPLLHRSGSHTDDCACVDVRLRDAATARLHTASVRVFRDCCKFRFDGRAITAGSGGLRKALSQHCGLHLAGGGSVPTFVLQQQTVATMLLAASGKQMLQHVRVGVGLEALLQLISEADAVTRTVTKLEASLAAAREHRTLLVQRDDLVAKEHALSAEVECSEREAALREMGVRDAHERRARAESGLNRAREDVTRHEHAARRLEGKIEEAREALERARAVAASKHARRECGIDPHAAQMLRRRLAVGFADDALHSVQASLESSPETSTDTSSIPADITREDLVVRRDVAAQRVQALQDTVRQLRHDIAGVVGQDVALFGYPTNPLVDDAGSLGPLLRHVALKPEHAQSCTIPIEVIGAAALRTQLCRGTDDAATIVVAARRMGLPVTVWPMDRLSAPAVFHAAAARAAGCVPAMDVLEYDAQYEVAVRRAFGRCWVAVDDERATHALRSAPPGVVVVTYCGNVHAQGRISGGHRALGAYTLFSRFARYKTLVASCRSKQADLDAAEGECARLRDQLRRLDDLRALEDRRRVLAQCRDVVSELLQLPFGHRHAVAASWLATTPGGTATNKSTDGNNLNVDEDDDGEVAALSEHLTNLYRDRVNTNARLAAAVESRERADAELKSALEVTGGDDEHDDTKAQEGGSGAAVSGGALNTLREQLIAVQSELSKLNHKLAALGQLHKKTAFGGSDDDDGMLERQKELILNASRHLQDCAAHARAMLALNTLLVSAVSTMSRRLADTLRSVIPSVFSASADNGEPLLQVSSHSSSLDFSLNLSALSGGQRTLVCIGFLCALASLRPSPIYLLDEIDAALDEVNQTLLVRLLLEGLRGSSTGSSPQIICISHHPTMRSAAAHVVNVENTTGQTSVCVVR
eukprot:PhM_4_TR13008/c0_g1_i1/m.67987